ncbi:MarC family protein [Paremcibacter congregatus]|nr:MarC family protein [Paremcibacter congregatus]
MMYELFIATFVTFFVVIDPLGIAPIFAVMTDGASTSFKRRMVFKSTLTGAIILLLFAFLGSGFLSALGISMMAFKTAGGVLLFMIALEMVFEKRTERREKTSEAVLHEHELEHEQEEAVRVQQASTKGGQKAVVPVSDEEDFEDISVFPMAIPFIAGPGSIATIMLMMTHHEGSRTEQGVIIGALLITILVTIIMLLMASKIIDLMGQTVANAITRILGVILAAMAIQYIFDGIKATFMG